ncbi:hypothetical protein LCGC14_2908040 [marine sediment metagenome]|uniref:Uncharacterized protein n=1 Tax=marine sediment metagenome TaxID=412755 RepID=A0A0F9AIL6_9ZZZZ
MQRELTENTRDQIWNAFFLNGLRLPVDDPQMTTTEVIAHKEEFIRYVNSVL